MSVLPRPVGSDRGLVLRSWPTGETSVIASVLTAEHGGLRLVAKGARQTRSRLRGLVQPGRLVDLEFSLDPARELQYLRAGAVLRDPLAEAPTLEKSAYLLAALELVDRQRGEQGHGQGDTPAGRDRAEGEAAGRGAAGDRPDDGATPAARICPPGRA